MILSSTSAIINGEKAVSKITRPKYQMRFNRGLSFLPPESLRGACFDGGVDLFGGYAFGRLGDDAFEPRGWDFRQNDDAVRVAEELEPVSRFQVQALAHGFGDGGLTFAAEGGFHGRFPPTFTF